MKKKLKKKLALKFYKAIKQLFEKNPKNLVPILCKNEFGLPVYATKNSAGLDLKANLKKDIVLKPTDRIIVPTGVYLKLPEGLEAQIRPRSGLAIKYGITVLNTPGTIDADYRGEIGVIIINLGNEDYTIKKGERIAQMVISKYEKITLQNTPENLFNKNSERGENGFGSTGK